VPSSDAGLADRFAQFRRDHRPWFDGWVHRDARELLDIEPQSPGALKVVRDLDAFGRLTGLHRHLARTLIGCLDGSGARPARVIDLCAGYGGFCRYLAAWAVRAAVPLAITGVDHSAAICAAAASQSSGAGITWRCADATRLDDEDRAYDLAINIQSLHHFDPSTAVTLLREMTRVARHVFVFDLRRTAYGFLALHLVRPFYSREFIHDGEISHRRAYSLAEAEFLVAEAGIRARVRRFLPVGMVIETLDGV
jgi:SAM-dependent methyltransferase